MTPHSERIVQCVGVHCLEPPPVLCYWYCPVASDQHRGCTAVGQDLQSRTWLQRAKASFQTSLFDSHRHRGSAEFLLAPDFRLPRHSTEDFGLAALNKKSPSQSSAPTCSSHPIPRLFPQTRCSQDLLSLLVLQWSNGTSVGCDQSSPPSTSVLPLPSCSGRHQTGHLHCEDHAGSPDPWRQVCWRRSWWFLEPRILPYAERCDHVTWTQHSVA